MHIRDIHRAPDSSVYSKAEYRQARLLLVVTWKEEGEWYLYQKLQASFQKVDVLQPFFTKRFRLRMLAALFDRLSPFSLAIRAFVRKGRYDVVISWSVPVGVFYGLLNRLFGNHRSPRHILRDFHISLVRKDWRYRLRLALLRYALQGIDIALCTSREEESIYAGMFDIIPERMVFYPDVPPSQFLRERALQQPVADYLFACGNSDRDFATLVEAVRELGCQTVILSQQYRPKNPLPANVQLISGRVSAQELEELIQKARVVVVPLEHYQVAAGQNSMLEAMAIGRPVIVSDNFATREYAGDGATALLYPPGDAARLRELIQQVFENRDAAEVMASRGRESVKGLLDEQVKMLNDYVQRFATRP